MRHNLMNLPELQGMYPICGFSNVQERRIVWELVSACNRTCKYCFATSEYDADRLQHMKALSVAQLVEAGDKLWRLGYRDIQFTGGELFLRKDALRILRAFREIGYEIAISTNCDFLNEAMAQELLALKLRSINVSLDSHHKEINDRIRGAGAFENTINGIKRLVHQSTRLRVHTVVTDDNRDHVDEVCDFVASLGVRLHTVSSRLPHVEPYDAGLATRLQAAIKRCPELEVVLLRVRLSPHQRPHPWAACSKGSHLIGIYSDGWITPCTLYLGAKPETANVFTASTDTLAAVLTEIDRTAGSITNTPCLTPRPQLIPTSSLKVNGARHD